MNCSKELDRLSNYMKFYIDRHSIYYTESKYKDLSSDNITKLAIKQPYEKISNYQISLSKRNVIDFNDTKSRCNKNGELLCNKYGINNIKDSESNRFKYVSEIYKDHLTVINDKLVAR